MKTFKVILGLAVILNGLPLAAIALYSLPIQSNEQFVLALCGCALAGMFMMCAGLQLVVKAVR